MASVAEALVRALSKSGIGNVFGLPGGEIVEIVDAVRRSDIDFTLVHQESSAAFMASATARLTGRPSACLTTLGPGATNAVTGVAHAYLDRAPVIVITAETSQALLPGHTHQVVDLESLFAPITKGSIQVTNKNAGEIVARAIELAITGRPGPVHLRLAIDVAGLAVEPGAVDEAQPPAVKTHLENELALETLRTSKRPIIVAGLGLEPQAPYDELRELAERLHAPVIVTPKAKGAISDQHPLSAGTIGLTHTDPVYELLDGADCVLAVGFDVVELVKPWEHPAPLIWIAAWPNADPKIAAAVELVNPIASSLGELSAATLEADTGWGEPLVAAHRLKYPALQAGDPESLLAPQTVFRILRELLPPEAVITTDVGSHKILACLEWPAYSPNRFLVSNGLSSMGYSLPAAIAAGLVLEGTPVVCTVGDAGMLMSMGELSTLARLNLPVTVVVFKDHALDLIRSHQHRRGKPTFATEFQAPDFVQIAEAHGIAAHSVSERTALDQAVRQAIASDGPVLIECQVDPATYPTAA